MYLDRSALPVGGGSDSPVTPYEPLLGIWSSVTRQTQLAGVQGPAWRIGVDEALRMYTIGSAYAAFDETRTGSIEAGKLADLVVLDKDPRAVEPEALREINVLQTFVDGRSVFER
jgi:predicted amidohydrolase YtcJ